MADIRKLVVDDRGIIKKVQAFLPGYKIYRNCEDLRTADNMLRKELVRRLSTIEDSIKAMRERIALSMEMDNINRIGELVNISHRVTEKVRHAEQGYAPWISGDVRIQEDELNALYEYDLSLLNSLENMKDEVSKAETSGPDENTDAASTIIKIRKMLEDFERTFDLRISKVTKVAQEGKGV